MFSIIISIYCIVAILHATGAFLLSPLQRQQQKQSKWSSSSSSSKLSARQLLEFVEPETKVPVKLVGAMHYNPTSIELATSTVGELADSEQLGSVIIESCDVRWNSSGEISPFIRNLLQSEMGAATDIALDYNRPVILGDQRINITTSRMKAAFQETLFDIAQPWNGGWGRVAGNVTEAWKETSAPQDTDKYYLSILSYFDPRLLSTAPISFFKYPLSYFAKYPLLGVGFFGFLFYVNTSPYMSVDQLEFSDCIVSIVIALLETAIFARVIVKEVLAERNAVLAQSILEQCRLYTSDEKSDESISTPSSDITYAPGCIPTTGDERGKTVVAILGMAHCNGIMKLLTEKEKEL